MSRRAVPLLSFAAIHRQFHRMSIRPLERFVTVEQSLNPIFSRLQLRKGSYRIAESARIERCFLSRLKSVNVNSENLLSVEVFVYLKARLFRVVFGKEQEQVAVERIVAARVREGDCETESGCRFCFYFRRDS